MKLFRSSLKFALPLGVILLASTALTQPLLAGEHALGVGPSGGATSNGANVDGSYHETGYWGAYSGPDGDGTFTQYQSDTDPSTVMYVTSYDDGSYRVDVFTNDGSHVSDGTGDGDGNGNGNGNGNNGNGNNGNGNGDGSDTDPNTPPAQPTSSDNPTGPASGNNGPVAGGGGSDDPDSGDAENPNIRSSGRGLGSHGTVSLKGSLQGSPLGGWLNQQGFGYGPHGNPGDQDNGSGPPSAPTRGSTGLTPRQLASLHQLENAAERAQIVMGTSMGSEEGGSESAPGYNTRGSGKSSNGNNTNNNSNKPKVSTGEQLGARPDLVNPAPRIAKGSAKSGASSAMQPGLLDGGSSFGGNGPSGTGSPVIGGRGSAGPAGLR